MTATAVDTTSSTTPFGQVAASLGADVPESILELRRSALDRLQTLGLPTPRKEEWKYTNLAPVGKESYALDLDRAIPREDFKPFLICDVASAEIVFVNGRYNEALSNCRSLPSSVVVEPLSKAWKKDDLQEALRATGQSDDEMHPFASLNTALLDEGVFIMIPDGVVIDKPIALLFVSSGGGEDRVIASPRIVVVAGESSQVRIVETFVNSGSSRVLSNPYTQILSRPNSSIDHYRVQQESNESFHFGLIRARQERDSHLRSHVITTGAAISRTDLSVVLDGEGADCVANGLYVLNDDQHADHQTLVDHAKPHCTSSELYKGILDDRSRGIFVGKVIVRPDAQKTNASQKNNNLILSREAIANTTPQLEIYADDVKCAHGSTIGRLDEEAMFYLRSRGVSKEDAIEILTWGFASEVTHGIRVGPVLKRLEGTILSRLAKEHKR